jgi:hypothetical protein
LQLLQSYSIPLRRHFFIAQDPPIFSIRFGLPHHHNHSIAEVLLHDLPSFNPSLLEDLLGPPACSKFSLSLVLIRHGWARDSTDARRPLWYVNAYYEMFQLRHFLSFGLSPYALVSDKTPFTALEQNQVSSLDPRKADGSSAVRFASVNEEIEPAHIDPVSSSQAISGKDEAKLKEISKSLHGTHLQERRMSHFAFEPVSLPASRVRTLPYQIRGIREARMNTS